MGTGKPNALTEEQPAAEATTQSPPVPPPNAVGQNASANAGQPPAKPGTTAAGKLPNSPDPRVFDDVLAELAALGPIQPEAQQRLIEDLRKTPPDQWPVLVQTFKAAMAYRRRRAERSSEESTATAGEMAQRTDSPLPNRVVPPLNVSATDAVSNPAKPVGNGPSIGAANQTPALPAAGSPANATIVTTQASESAAGRVAAEGTWQQHLDAAIRDLDRQVQASPQDSEALANHVHLRLLDLAAGRRDDALKPIPGLSPAQQDYWSKQLFALATYLDSQRVSDPGRRAAEAGIHLNRAVASLAEQSPLVVRNLAFCTDVQSYGVLKRVEPAEFKPGQQLLLYAEVENFKCEETAHGFHTSLEARYQILDSQGRRVAHDDLPLTEEDCQNRRRDFFVHYFLTLPKSIYDGSYRLELTIEDKLAKKIGQSTIDFSVKEKK